MTILTEILLFVYASGFVGGVLCGLPAGILAAIAWGLARRRRQLAMRRTHREQRAAEARAFAEDVDRWIEEFEAEKVNEADEPKVRVIGK